MQTDGVAGTICRQLHDEMIKFMPLDNPSNDTEAQTMLRERAESLIRALSVLDNGQIEFMVGDVTKTA